MENRKRKWLIIIAAVVMMLCVLFGCSLPLGKKDNTMNVVQAQDNSFSIPSYNENDSHVFSFLPAEDAEGELTYELISAKDKNYKNVEYFTLVSDKDTRIMVAKATPADTYTLTIRAHAEGNGGYKEAYKDITYLYTIDKADNDYRKEPEPVEGLMYNNEIQELVHPGEALYGTIMYKVDDGEWTTQIPAMSEAGIYTVSYKVIGDENHKDIDELSFMAVIEQQRVAYRPGVSFSSSSSLGGLLDYIRQKADAAAAAKIRTSDKPANFIEYTYDGAEHDNGYNAPQGIEKVGEDRGTCAGTYIAVYTPDYNHCWSDGTRTPVVVTLKINRQKLTKPTIDDSLYYTGKSQEAIIEGFDSEKMRVLGNKAKNPGTYYAVVGLKDVINYSWDDDSIADFILEWHIHKNGIKIPEVTTTFTYKATAALDIPVVQVLTPCDFDEFNEKLIKIVSGNTGANAGDYQVRLALKDKEHFEWEDGTTEDKYVTWTINRRSVGDKPADRTVTYDGKIHDNGYDKPHYVEASGISVAREAGEYFAYYKPYDNYCWSDGSYGVVAVKLTVEKADPKYSAPTPIEGLFYTGSYQELIKGGYSHDGTMMYKVDSAGSSGNYTTYIPTGMKAKTYTVSYYCAGDKNHKDSEAVSFEVVIDVNNRTHLSLVEMPKAVSAGESFVVGIDTNSNGTLSCYSSSDDVACSVDEENSLLYVSVSEEAMAQQTAITIAVSGGDYADNQVTYPLTVNETIEEDDVQPESEITETEEIDQEIETKEELEETEEETTEELVDEDPDKVTDEVTVPEEKETETLPEEENKDDVETATEPQPAIPEAIREFEIATGEAEILDISIVRQLNADNEPVSYFTKEGRLIKPKKDTPAGTYTVTVEVTLQFVVDEKGNTTVVALDSADELIAEQLNNSSSEENSYVEIPVETREEESDDEEEIIVPEVINNVPQTPEVIVDNEKDPDEPDPNNDPPIINVEQATEEEQEESTEAPEE